MAVVERGADHRIRADASSSLAGVGPRAEIAVVAGCSVRLEWVWAGSSCRIAGADGVALIEGGADDWIRADAGSGLAGVGLSAEIAVVAGCPLVCGRIRAASSRGLTDPDAMALIGGADDSIRAPTDAFLARVDSCAEISVVARRVFRHLRVGAHTGCGIAGADVVALIECRADDWIRADAGSGLAGVSLCAEIGVVAGRSVRRGRVGALTGARFAHARIVALVEGGADDWIRADTTASQTGVASRAQGAVITRCTVQLRRVGAQARSGVADTGHMAFTGGAHDWGRPHTTSILAAIGRCTEITVIAG